MSRFVPAVLMLLVCLPVPSAAGSLTDEPYFLRLFAALRRPAGAGFSTAMALQATAANPGGFSINPAADDVLQNPSGPATISSTLNNLHTYSDSGAWLTDTFLTTSIHIPELGTIPLAYARTDTIDTAIRGGLDNSLRSNEFFWGYSKKISDSVALGVQARYLTAEVQFEAVAPPIFAPTRVEVDVLYNFDVNLGVRWQLNRMIALGVVGGVGVLRTTSDVTNITPLPNPAQPPSILPAGTLLAQVDDRPQSGLVRVGCGYTPSAKLGIYVDGEYYNFASDTSGTVEIGRALAGIEYRPCRHRAIFLGSSLDKWAELTLSFGFRRALTEKLVASMSYQFNSYPELDPEFGRFDQITMTAACRY